MFRLAWVLEKLVRGSLSAEHGLTVSLHSLDASQSSGVWHRRTAHEAGRVWRAAIAAMTLLLPLFMDQAEAAVSSASLTVGTGADSLTFSIPLTATPNGGFVARGSQSITSNFSLEYDFTGLADPTVTGSFALTNLSSVTQAFSLSLTLAVPSVPGPTSVSGSYAQGLLTAPVGTPPATVTANPFYQARIDGITVATLGSNLNITTSGGSAIIPAEAFPTQPGPGVSSSIGTAFQFTLTAQDTVDIPSFKVTVEPVPEPASVVLLAVGLVIVVMGWGRLPARSARPS